MFRNIQDMTKGVWKNVPHFLKNRYIVVTVLFLIHLFFIDNSSIPTQIKLSKLEKELEEQKIYYIGAIEELKERKATLETQKELIAREKYYLQKENEDIFIIDK